MFSGENIGFPSRMIFKLRLGLVRVPIIVCNLSWQREEWNIKKLGLDKIKQKRMREDVHVCVCERESGCAHGWLCVCVCAWSREEREWETITEILWTKKCDLARNVFGFKDRDCFALTQKWPFFGFLRSRVQKTNKTLKILFCWLLIDQLLVYKHSNVEIKFCWSKTSQVGLKVCDHALKSSLCKGSSPSNVCCSCETGNQLWVVVIRVNGSTPGWSKAMPTQINSNIDALLNLNQHKAVPSQALL